MNGHQIPYDNWLMIKENMFEMIQSRKFNNTITELSNLNFKKSKYDKRKRGWRYEVSDEDFGLYVFMRSHYCGICGNVILDLGTSMVYGNYCNC